MVNIVQQIRSSASTSYDSYHINEWDYSYLWFQHSSEPEIIVQICPENMSEQVVKV